VLGRRAASLAGDVTELVEDVKVVRQMLRDDPSGRLAAAVELALLRAREERRRRRERAAAAGASTLETKPGRAGAMFVRIDGSEWFRLSRGDARLLLILAKASPGADGFPGSLSYEELADAVVFKGGRRPTRRAIVEASYRVRRALDAVDLNRQLLKCDRKAGRVRFLLRAGSGGGGERESRSSSPSAGQSGAVAG
jgi:hypothetical protein